MAISPIRCIVVDDEHKAADHIAGMVRQTPFLELVDVSTDPHEALAWVMEGRAELVFLDLNMPVLHGTDFVRMAGGKSRFIITTGFAEYALQGYELGVTDYIAKPVTYQRFLMAAGKALEVLRPAAPASPVARPDCSFIRGVGRQQFYKVDHKDICYIQAEGYKSILHLKEGCLESSTPLSELEATLPEGHFLRVHRSFIVALTEIETISNNIITIQQTEIPIGQSYQEKFYQTVR
ncbi:LytTR family DNA-binding domain-containing protein [Chitinophaga sp.]|uniref:LytR/AlgR family response regulator transcription factor n=1 Tax=Chitinophaga sp. TaxID=1869181 RepID=UPI0031DB3B67